MRGIHAFDVEGRIGFGVTQALRFFQHGVEAQALVAHFGQDEVGGAVDDAGDPFDAVGGQAFAQRLDDGDAAGHCRLERHHHALVLRRLEYFVAVRGQQCLVGGDHMLAVGDRLQHQLFRHTIAADQFDDDVHFRIGHHGKRIVGHATGAAGDFLRQFHVLVRHHGDADGAAGTAGDFFRVALQYGEGAAADGADAEKSYVDWFHAHDSSLLMVGQVRAASRTRHINFSPTRLSVLLAIVFQEARDARRWPRSGRRHWAGTPRGSDPDASS